MKKWNILFVTNSASVWPFMQIGMTDNAQLKVLVPSNRKNTIQVQKDHFGVKEFAALMDLGNIDIYVGGSKTLLSGLLSWCDFVYIDNSFISAQYLFRIQKWAKHHDNKPIIYGSDAINALEYSREIGQAFCKMHGLHTTSGNDAISLKTASNLKEIAQTSFANPPVVKSNWMTFLPRNWNEFESVAVLMKNEEKRLSGKIDILLERNLSHDCVCEVAFASYFNGNEFADAVIFTIEYKHAFDCTMPNILSGESATNMMVLHKDLVPQFHDVLNRFKWTLHNCEYRGFFDLNCLFLKDGTVRVLEQTARPGYPTEIELFDLFRTRSLNKTADILAWTAGLIDKADLPDPNVLPTNYYSDNVALQSVITGLDVSHKIPPITIVDGNEFDSGPNGVRLIPADCRIDELGRPVCEDFDRTAFLMTNRHIPTIANNISIANLKKIAADCKASINEYAQNVSAWGHTYRKNSDERMIPDFLDANKFSFKKGYEISSNVRLLTAEEIVQMSKDKVFLEKLEYLNICSFGAYEDEKYDSERVVYDFDQKIPVAMLRVRKRGRNNTYYVEEVCVAPGYRGPNQSYVYQMLSSLFTSEQKSFEGEKLVLECDHKLRNYYLGLSGYNLQMAYVGDNKDGDAIISINWKN